MHRVKLEAAVLFGAAGAAGLSPVGSLPRATCNYTDLSSRLSITSNIILPGSNEFDAAVARWSSLAAPAASVVVVPGTEDDVVETVRRAACVDLSVGATNRKLTFPRSNSPTSAHSPFSPPTVSTAPSPPWAR